VKNWEIEASFKKHLSDWRTIAPGFTFSLNGRHVQEAQHIVEVGTYNAMVPHPNRFYNPDLVDFEKSHMTFKAMMPTFAWEVIEVYSGPPRAVFKWRHWGEMKNDYVGWDS
jgi:hypothetical protein